VEFVVDQELMKAIVTVLEMFSMSVEFVVGQELLKVLVIAMEIFSMSVECVMDLVQYTIAVVLIYQKGIVIVMETF
jgi:hypothetical protein